MKITTREILLWAPRIVGLGLSAFLALFALDALSDPRGLLATAMAVGMGIIPALIVLGTVIVGWKRPLVAALVFAILAVIYSVSVLSHPGWIVVIAGPLMLAAILFLLSARSAGKQARGVSHP